MIVPLFRQGSNDHQDGTPVDPLPNYLPPQESRDTNARFAARDPLNPLSPKAHAFLNSGYANIVRQLNHAGDPNLIIYPSEAEQRPSQTASKSKCSTIAGVSA